MSEGAPGRATGEAPGPARTVEVVGTSEPAHVVCVQGPTASGKSELAEYLAEKLGGEIVSADSMQVYRGMDIGTAKVPPERRRVPYHCIDILDPGEPYSAALFQRDGRAAIRDIESRGRLPVLCGGTGFYVSAVLDKMDFAPGDQEGNPVREKYTALASELGPKGLHDLLAERDPESAALIHPNNVRRVVRAFEMLEEGESYAERKRAFKTLPAAIPSVKIALGMERSRLYARIDARVDQMVDDGLVEEVERLVGRGFRDGLTAPQAIGYKEVVRYLDGEESLDDAVEEIKRSTRRYAKRQLSWLRRDPDLHWLDVGELTFAQLAEKALQIVGTRI